MASPPSQPSPDRMRQDFQLDSPMDDHRLSGRSSVRASMQPRTPNQNMLRQVSRATRPAVIIPNDDVSVRNEHDRESLDSSVIGASGEHIWGTNVNIDRVSIKFRRFIENFTKDDAVIYPELIEDAIEAETFCLPLDCKHLYDFDRDLYYQLIRYPQEMLPAIDAVVNSFADERFSEILNEISGNSDEIWTRPYNLQTVRSMRDMNPLDIDSLVALSGMVIRSSSIIPDIQEAFFKCQMCENTVTVAISFGRIVEPNQCNNSQCQGKNCMELIHNRCVFQDKQLVKLQETPENIPDGETPQTIDIYCYDALVDQCKPGDRIQITGVYRAAAIRRNPRRKEIDAVYKTYIDAVHINKVRINEMSSNESDFDDFKDLRQDNENEEDVDMINIGTRAGNVGNVSTSARMGSVLEPLSRQRETEAKIKELSLDPDIYEKLVNSFAPSIWQMEDVKKGILCQLFGASRKDFTYAGGGKFRSQLNILLCGDPGTSKSQLLQYVHKVAPRGIYTSGKGSSAVGLTAYISKDAESGDLVLESGALVLSDRGICCIDEFDKMSEAARSVLHEVMEQQTVSIAKAGIICTLNARTSILAAANPIESRYNPTKSVIENIDLPPTLMSRFDLIYLVLDRPNEGLDRKLARHIVSLYYSEEELEHIKEENRMNVIENDLFIKYIEYSRREINPILSEAACQRLTDAYLELRSMGREAGKKVITATPRQLESLIRISEALARMRHSMSVEENDVDEALRLHRVATLAAATDPRTGAIDLDSIAVGRTAEQGRELENQANLMLEVLRGYKRRTIRVNALLMKYNNKVEEMQQNEQSGQSGQGAGSDSARDAAGAGAGAAGTMRKIGLNDLKKIVERLEQAERVRPGEWLQDDPMITILSRDAL